MSSYVYRGSKEIEGPWLLNTNSLIDLSNRLNTIINSFKAEKERIIDSKVEEKIIEVLKDKNTTYDDIDKKAIKQDYIKYDMYANKFKYEVEINTYEGKIFKSKSLESTLSDTALDEVSIEYIDIRIEIYSFKFIMKIGRNYEKGLTLDVVDSLEKNSDILNNIHSTMDPWIDKYRSSIFVRKWVKNYDTLQILPYITFIVLALFLLLTFFPSTDSKKDIELKKLKQYKSELKSDAYKLLANNLEKTEKLKAIEILLKLESDYVPKNYELKKEKVEKKEKIEKKDFFESTKVRIGSVWVLAMILLLLRPKTTFGVGRHKNKYHRMKFLERAFLTIPIWFFTGYFAKLFF